MSSKKKKILILVEGSKTEVVLINHLMSIYDIDSDYEIVSYETSIYTLYKRMFSEGDPDSMDLVQCLKEHEKNFDKKKIFDNDFTDKILIFDFDPQDTSFSKDEIIEMMNYFTESSDMGKLYINYPMVESFYHMKNIPDKDFNSYYTTMYELTGPKDKRYKTRVNKENRNHDYKKFAVNRMECNIVIKQNISKAQMLTGLSSDDEVFIPESIDILKSEINELENYERIPILCTCIFYIAEYNPNLIK